VDVFHGFYFVVSGIMVLVFLNCSWKRYSSWAVFF
jgi:hypothetical protein